MDANIKTALSQGSSFREILDAIGADEREDLTVVSFVAGTPDGVLTMARIGRTMIQVDSDGDTMLVVHHHGPERDALCWQHAVDLARAEVTAANAEAQRLRDNPRAQELLQAGAPLALVRRLLGPDAAPDTTAMPARTLPPIRPVPIPQANLRDDDGTGFYI